MISRNEIADRNITIEMARSKKHQRIFIWTKENQEQLREVEHTMTVRNLWDWCTSQLANPD